MRFLAVVVIVALGGGCKHPAQHEAAGAARDAAARLDSGTDSPPALTIDAAVTADAATTTDAATPTDAAPAPDGGTDGGTGAAPHRGSLPIVGHNRVCQKAATGKQVAQCGRGLQCCYPCGIGGCDWVCHTRTECELDRRRP